MRGRIIVIDRLRRDTHGVLLYTGFAELSKTDLKRLTSAEALETHYEFPQS